MAIHNDLAEPRKWTAYSSGGGYAGLYRHMGRDVLLSEVSKGVGESLLSLDVAVAEGGDYLLSFLYWPVVTAKSGPVTIIEIEGVIRVTQDDFTAPGAFHVEVAGSEATCPDYSLSITKWNCFELLALSSGALELLINGRRWAGRNAPAPGITGTMTIMIGCGGNPARSMWDRFRFEALREQDVRLTANAQQRHDFFRSVVFESPSMHLVFDARCVRGEDLYTQADWQYPGFQTGSTLYGRPLTDMDRLSVFGIRKHGVSMTSPNTNRIELHCHNDYELEVHSAGGKVVAFSTTSTTDFSPLRGTATYYLFSGLPGVIFCSCRFENTFPEPVPRLAAANFAGMMCTRGERDSQGTPIDPAYDGVRLWIVPGESLWYFYGTNPRSLSRTHEDIDYDGGIFVKWPRHQEGYYGAWFTGDSFSLAKGLAIMQKGGVNDWAENPPIGNIFTNERHYGTFTTIGDEYTSMATELRLKDDLSAPGAVGEEELIFFSLKPECPVNTDELLYNLERAFNLPPVIQSDPLHAGEQPCVYACEVDGLHRTWQIISLPWVYGNMCFEEDIGDVFPGSVFSGRKPVKTVLLMRDVSRYDRIPIGRLPISLVGDKQNEWIVESQLDGLLGDFWIHIDDNRSALRCVNADRSAIKAWRTSGGRIEICIDLEPGITRITCS